MKAEISAYLQNIHPDRQNTFLDVRKIILDTLGEAEETIQYRMPTYGIGGKLIVALAAQKHYFSLYVDVKTLDAYRDQFNHLNCGKSCIRFKKLSDLPLDTIKIILRETLAQNERCV
jgi:uncharacterized protein YdhG (YjbR/CyaY superfamily)